MFDVRTKKLGLNMEITASELRSNLYRLLDQVVEEGKPLTIRRKGHVLKIVCEDGPTKLGGLPRHPCIAGDPEDLVHLDWSGEWKHDLP